MVARGPALEATLIEAPALAFRPQAEALSGFRPPGEDLDDARQGVGAVEAARGAAHHLDPLQLEGQQAAEVEAAAGLVHRDPVHQDAGEARFAAAHEGRRLQARSPRARSGDPRRLLEELEERGRRALGDPVAVPGGGAGPEGGERSLAPGGRDHHLLAQRRRREHEIEAGGAGVDPDPRLGQENEAGGGHDQDVLAGGQACHLIAPFRARDQRAWAGRADQGEGEGRHRPAIGRPYRTGEHSRPGRQGGREERGSEPESEGDGQGKKAHDSSLRRPDATGVRGGGKALEGWPDVLELLHARKPRGLSVRAGFLAPGSSPRLQPSPGLPEWRRVLRLKEAGSPATVAGPRRPRTCFPITPPKREAP